jgi:ribosome-binding factor A
MSRRRKRTVDELKHLAAELGPEDGGDSREFHDKPWNAPKQASRKAQLLCGQIKDALNLLFPACADVALQGLWVVTVKPAPHTGRLLVLLSLAQREDRAHVLGALSRASAFLRREMATAICRRHAPELIFEVTGM